MTTSSSSRPPLPTIATKSSSTAQSSRLNVIASDKNTCAPRTSSRVPPNSTSRQDGTAQDATSERATLSLIRRTLVADGRNGTDSRATPAPIEGILPPLTSSNEIDVQLYAIVAIVIKDFVNSWYSKITPDHAFVDEVIQIIAHCSRALEQRLRQIDITELILDELPVLVERHIEAYRTATTAQAVLQYGESPRRIYHSLNPHPALDPSLPRTERQDYEAAYRQLLIQGALAVLLPTEDLANTCLRTLVTDIIADLILGQALAEKLCQPWFLHGTVSKLVGIVTSNSSHAADLEESVHERDRQSRLEKFGLLSANLADQEHHSSARHQSTLSAWFWGLLQYAYIAYQSLRFMLVGMVHAHHLPQRIRHRQANASTSLSSTQKPPLVASPSAPDAQGRSPRAVINYRVFSCVSAVLDLSTRMPWLASSLAWWQHVLNAGPGGYGATNSTLDK
ncbi:PXA domain-containing protein [Exophiala viscosa]|uniref:PXA domain-containing protein n=1 Tax=Exophiala viscosa TaxID=2486360 RepID=A0AAN6ICH5_9EURO|nr:PXA domain-containing protein [Exophiala viscosa]